MKLNDFLTSLPGATGSAGRKRVTFTLTGRNSRAEDVSAPGYACFVRVSDKDEEEANLAAFKDAREQSKDLGLLPQDLLDRKERAHFLASAMREFEDPRQPFAAASELQTALSGNCLQRLRHEYDAWVSEMYPAEIQKSDRDAAKADAQKK